MPENNDRYAFATLMAVLGTAFGENGMPKARTEIYYDQLKDIPIDVLKRAVESILRHRKYSSIPTIAEIREAALGRDEDIETAALEAWSRASRAVECSLYLCDGTLLDEAVRVAFGGWERFGQTDREHEMADRAHFLKVFRSLARKRRDLGRPALCPAKEIRQLEESGHEEIASH